MMFCTIKGTECINYMKNNGIIEYSIIDWCKQFLNNNSTFVDIGAHMGTYSVILSKYCKTVHAFECSSDTYKGLLTSIDINNINNIIPHCYALGEEEKILPFYLISDDGGGCSLMKEATHNKNVQTINVNVR